MGDPISQGKGAILGENVAAYYKVMGHSTVRCAKTAKLIVMSFWMKTQVGPRNHVLDGGADSLREWQFWGLSGHARALTTVAAESLPKESFNRQ